MSKEMGPSPVVDSNVLENVITPLGRGRVGDILSALIRNTDSGFWMFEVDTENHLVSEQWCLQLGYETGELDGSYEEWKALIHQDDLDRVENYLRHHLAGRSDRYTQEFRLRHKDGRYSWFRTDGATIRDSHAKPIALFGWHIDIDDQHEFESRVKSLSQDLNSALELAALGELVGGLVHEIAGPITVLQARLAMAELQLQKDQLQKNQSPKEGAAQAVAKLVAELRPAVDQIIRVHSGLRTLIREGHVEGLAEVNLVAIAEKAIEFVRTRMERNQIQVKLFNLLAPNMRPVVEGNGTQLMEVIINLLNNGIDATVEKRSGEERREIQIRIRSTQPGMVGLEVADSGGGVAEAVKARLMSPLVTTKQRSGGMGLGLSISKRIVEAHHGALTLEAAHDSELGGALFQVSLPIAGFEAQLRSPTSSSNTGISQ